MHRVLAAALGAGATGAVVLGQLLGHGDRDLARLGLVAGMAVPFLVLGLLVLASVPRHPVGVLMTAAGTVAAVHLVAMSWSDLTALAWLSQWLWWPALGLAFAAVLVFPDGGLPTRRWWPVAATILGGTVATSVLLAAAAVGEPRLLTDYRLDRADWVEALLTASRVTGLLAGAGFAGAVASLGVRWWRSESGSDQRLQLACLLPCGVLLLVGIVLSLYGLPAAWALVAWSVPAGMCVAILRYRLFDIDLVVNRTLVWLVLTVVLVGVVALAVKLLSDVLFSLTEGTAAMVATGFVVLSFEPLHRRVQRSVDQLMYGERDDPYRVIARLGALLRGTADPAAVMPLVADAIADSLQVPFVAMELDEGGGRVVAARSGRPVEVTESFAMVAHGDPVGALVVGRRSSGTRFSARERALLEDLAVQAGVAAEASRLTRDLQRLRDRLVSRRESELLRLRRELHDRLGPGFTGLRLQVRAARRARDRDRLDELFDSIDGGLAVCSDELRHIIDQMRPPALDQGLEDAVRAECRRFDCAELDVVCEIGGDLGDLPTAVEVAAYRILAEALTNAARHADAEHCWVHVDRDRDLTLTVTDDGRGVTDQDRHGVGTESMRERARELGGTCSVAARRAPGGGSGTVVAARLPIATGRTVAPGPSPPATDP